MKRSVHTGGRFFNSSAPAQGRPGRKFDFESAVDFERVTRSRNLANEIVFGARCKRGLRFKPISAAVLLPASLPQLPSCRNERGSDQLRRALEKDAV
jgi:hypothetical protein